MSDSPKPAPYPTKNRLRLMRDIADGKVVEYTTEEPSFIFSNGENRRVTSRVVELAGLVSRDTPVQQTYFKIVALTEAGQRYLDTYGKNGATS